MGPWKNFPSLSDVDGHDEGHLKKRRAPGYHGYIIFFRMDYIYVLYICVWYWGWNLGIVGIYGDMNGYDIHWYTLPTKKSTMPWVFHGSGPRRRLKNDGTFTTARMIKRCYRFSTLRQEISGSWVYHGISWYIMLYHAISWYIMVHRHAVSCLLVNSQEFQSFVGSTSKFIWSIPSHEQSRKLQVHGKDIQKLERSHRLPVCTRMIYVKLGGNRLKDNYVHAQLWHNLPRGYRYFERAHRHYGNPNVHPPWFQAWKMQHLPKNIRE